MKVFYNHSGVDAMTCDILQYIISKPRPSGSRAGPVIRAASPVTIVTDNPSISPWSRSVVRDANPLFHLREALWILEGRGDVAPLAEYNTRYVDYAEPESGIVHGAYGHRMRKAFGYDQLERVIDLLTKDHTTRQAVLGLWSPDLDMAVGTEKLRDRPCNTQVYVDITAGAVNIMVTQRSGDLFWGTLGANHVCFRVLHHYLAHRLHASVGVYTHTVFNLHVYQDKLNLYQGMSLEERFTRLSGFEMNELLGNYNLPELIGNLDRVRCLLQKDKEPQSALDAIDALSSFKSSDYRRTAELWLARRFQKRKGTTQ